MRLRLTIQYIFCIHKDCQCIVVNDGLPLSYWRTAILGSREEYKLHQTLPYTNILTVGKPK